MDYGKRADGEKKGDGYFGPLRRPGGGVSTEISVGVGIDGKEVEIPLIVPTLTKQELDAVLRADPAKKDFFDRIPDTIIDKAYEHAVSRINQGKSPFAGPNDRVKAPK
jgi:hypothetical protein